MSKSNKPLRSVTLNNITDELRDEFSKLAKGEEVTMNVENIESAVDDTTTTCTSNPPANSTNDSNDAIAALLLQNVDVVASVAKRALGVSIDVEYIVNLVSKLDKLDNQTPENIVSTIKQSLEPEVTTNAEMSLRDRMRIAMESNEGGFFSKIIKDAV